MDLIQNPLNSMTSIDFTRNWSAPMPVMAPLTNPFETFLNKRKSVCAYVCVHPCMCLQHIHVFVKNRRVKDYLNLHKEILCRHQKENIGLRKY